MKEIVKIINLITANNIKLEWGKIVSFLISIIIPSVYKLIKSSRGNVITFCKIKHTIKNTQTIIVYNYNAQKIKEILLDIKVTLKRIAEIVIYLISYYLICTIIVNILPYLSSIYFKVCFIFILIFIVPLFAQIDFKTKQEKIVSTILLEDIYMLILVVGLHMKYWEYIYLILISIVPFALILLYELKYISGREYENNIIMAVKLIRLIIVFIVGIVIRINYNVFVALLIVEIAIIYFESLLVYYLDTSKHFKIEIKINNGEIITTKESIVMCNDGRLGLILEDNTIIFIERDEIEYITYNMEYEYLFRNRKIRVTDEKGSKEFDDYYWRNKEWIFCKKKDSEDSKKYKVYVYDVKKVKQIKLS